MIMKFDLKSIVVGIIIGSIGLTTASGQVCSNNEHNSISVSSPTDKSKIRLLEEATEYVGAVSPEKTIDIWSNGLKERSAALQYIVMTESLKENYEKSLEKNGYDFWITGVSSPWVEDYELLKTNKLSDDAYEYDIKYNTRTSEGKYNFLVTLKLIKEGDFWKVAEVKGDEDSRAYTGF